MGPDHVVITRRDAERIRDTLAGALEQFGGGNPFTDLVAILTAALDQKPGTAYKAAFDDGFAAARELDNAGEEAATFD